MVDTPTVLLAIVTGLGIAAAAVWGLFKFLKAVLKNKPPLNPPD